MAINKFFILLPVMFAARKLNGEDPNTLFLLRCTYFSVQTFIILVVIYLYSQAQKVGNGKHQNVTIYVPPPPQPFADPNAKRQYKQVNFGKHIITTARSLLVSTIFGFLLTTALHFYKGMIIGLSIQSVMSPFNLFENALTKAFLLNGGFKDGDSPQSKKIFGEKLRVELTHQDEVVDERGEIVVFDKTVVTKEDKQPQKSFDDILLDTWDEGAEANIKPFMDAVKKKNVNTKTSDLGWTPVMIMAAIGVKETAVVLEKMKSLGANPGISDEEGWNALHWAAFHSSVDGAKFLLSSSGFDGLSIGLHLVKDKEGKTPLEHACAEGNMDVAKIIQDAISASENNKKCNSLD